MPESKDTDRRKEQAMGRIWLCEEETAKRPFLLEEEGRRLYSFEELCYYLYQNTGVPVPCAGALSRNAAAAGAWNRFCRPGAIMVPQNWKMPCLQQSIWRIKLP